MEKSLFHKILKIAKDKKGQTIKTEVDDLVNVCKNKFETDKDTALSYCRELKVFLDKRIRGDKDIGYLMDAYFRVLVLETPYSLDSYFLALEFNRDKEDKFWFPRRKQLLPTLHDIEDLLINDKLDEMYLSMPARVGKSTLAVFVTTWIMGVKPELANLYCSNNGSVVSAFYKGIAEILCDEYTYLWWKIFPTTKFDKSSFMNAKDTYIDTGRIKRYHSFTGRSIDAGLNGACDCNGLLIGDDLVSGIEEALNVSRLNSLYAKVNNDLITRAKMGSKILWIGTRWSLHDPMGRRIRLFENDPTFASRRVKIVKLPALNENNESNFDYKYGKGYSTDYYLQIKRIHEDNNDLASFLAQYQQEPIERTGLVIPTVREYNGVLPSNTPDRKFAFCDIAWGGGDFTSMPIAYQFGDQLYIPDWVFTPENKLITRPKVINAILKHRLGSVRFEKNNGGDEYREYVETQLIKKGYKCNITSRTTTINKQVKIYEHAPEIAEIFFLEPKLRSKEYAQAVQQVVSYTGLDKKQHDDAPDSLSGIIDMFHEVVKMPTIEIFKRPF